ncbi:MAG: hypothetical protein JHC31_08335 [Sulfurihydrogenibium sp.]|jgi:hypothetical protein|nr:hypothetical protein [Sulfurihydrogenibium sp.]
MAKRRKIKKNKKWFKIHVVVDLTSKQVMEYNLIREKREIGYSFRNIVEGLFSKFKSLNGDLESML